MKSAAEWIARCPKKLWIGTFTCDLHLVPNDDEKVDKGESDGLTEFPTAIYLCYDRPLTIMLESAIHEITHFIDFAVGIEDGAIEEDIADKHGKAWTCFWIDNPKFQRWWNSACIAVREERTGKKR